MTATLFKRRRERLRDLPKPIRHRKSRDGIVSMWRKIASTVYSTRVLDGLPPFAEPIAKTFWDIDPAKIIDAICDGDPALLFAFEMRIDQLDHAMVQAGLTIADRAPLVQCRFLVAGFRQAAVDVLVKKGGAWPPVTEAFEPRRSSD